MANAEDAAQDKGADGGNPQEDDSAPGWDAIDAALLAVYGPQEPKHFGTILSYQLGGRDPLQGISVYTSTKGRPHWHYVTYGFSDLYGEEVDEAEDAQRGYGFELTFRLAMPSGTAPDAEPPTWPLNLLQNLARYVFDSGNAFAAGHWMPANGPIATVTSTALTELAFVADPELPAIGTECGQVAFLQVVGLTADELDLVKRWNTRGVLQTMGPHMPLFITDLDRASLHADPALQAAVTQGQRADGASTGTVYPSLVQFSQRKRLLRTSEWVIRLGSLAVKELKAILPGRLPHGKGLSAVGEAQALRFVPTDTPAAPEADEDLLTVPLTDEQMQAWLQAVRGRTGNYTVPGLEHVVWQVETSAITDAQDRVIGHYEE